MVQWGEHCQILDEQPHITDVRCIDMYRVHGQRTEEENVRYTQSLSQIISREPGRDKLARREVREDVKIDAPHKILHFSTSTAGQHGHAGCKKENREGDGK